MVPGSSGSPRFCFALLQRFSAPHERWAPETMAKIFTVPFGAGSRSPPPILVSSSSSSPLSGEISFSPTPARASAADTSGNSHLPLTDNRAHYSAALFHNPLLRWPPCGRASTVRRSLVLVELFFLALVPVGWLVCSVFSIHSLRRREAQLSFVSCNTPEPNQQRQRQRCCTEWHWLGAGKSTFGSPHSLR